MGSPSASSPGVAARMRAVRQSQTKPESDLQQELRLLGCGFSTDTSVVPGSRRRADIVFQHARVAVLVHGCFWHSCPKHSTTPKTNTDWWIDKLTANRRRDRDTVKQFRASGWSVVLVWAHEEMSRAARRIQAAVKARS